MDLYQHTAKELRQKLLGKECSAAEIAQSVFSRIDACEERVGAYVTLDRENALAAAEAVDKKIAAGEEIGPLAGIPVAVKDSLLASISGSSMAARGVMTPRSSSSS